MRLGFGCGSLEMDAEGCELVMPQELSPALPGEIERALSSPIGADISALDGARTAAILASDITRPSPSHLLVPPMASRLRSIGVSDLLVVFGLGTHRRMTVEEEMHLLGEAAILPHCQHDPARCLSMGHTSAGTPVEIFEEVAACDIIVGTGNIEYHYYAGYSGGAKAILPGVSSERSVNLNHAMMRDPRSRSGRLDSPVRLDMEEAAAVAGLDFILNVVLNSRKEIVSAVAGHYVKAHRCGAATVDRMYLRPVRPAEIVVTCAGGRPKDLNLFQAEKALENARAAALPGGTIILVAECSEGLGHPVFQRWIDQANGPQDCLDRFGREYQFGGHKAAYLAEQALRNELILVSGLDQKTAESCFFTPARDLASALAEARERHGQDARVVVMPHGNLTLAKGV